jgi:hypothetical protein
MATTTNYSWTTPDNTAYVKDGASAIRTLGSSVDTTLFGITGGKNVGHQAISTTTFASASSFSVNNCFTSAYTNYQIVLDIRTQTAGFIYIRYRASSTDNTSSNYAQANFFSTTTTSSERATAQTSSQLLPNTGQTATRGLITVLGPQATTPTLHNAHFTSEAGSIINLASGGFGLTNSFDGFTIIGGNMSGTVYVYGLRN